MERSLNGESRQWKRTGSSRFRPRHILFLLSAFWLLPSILFAAPTQVRQLDNGLTIVFKENHSAPVVAVRVYVKTGSMLEGKYAGAGISHVLEHLVHGAATPKRTEAEGRQLLESIGNNSNAYTTKEHTCFYINTASRYFDTALDLLSDWVGNASFPQADFDREMAVVQRELEKLRDGGRRVDFMEQPFPAVIYRDVPTRPGYRHLHMTDVLVVVPGGYPGQPLDGAHLPEGSPLLGRVAGSPQGFVVADGRRWQSVSYHPHNGGGAAAWNKDRHGLHTYFDEILCWIQHANQ